ncbi:unnamed protein product, partial [marine sediment metagenome]
PGIVGITNLSIQNDNANEIAREVKKYDKNILVVKGGFHELFGWEYTLELHHEYVDYVVVGEGEKTIVELTRAYEQGRLEGKRQDIIGLAYYDYDNKKSHFNGMPIPLRGNDLDAMIPTRLFYDESYNFDVLKNKKTAQIMTVRGCIYNCNFCTESSFKSVRKRTIDSVFSELTELARDGYKAIYFDDSTFTINHKRVIEICGLFKEHFPVMIWGCNTRDDRLDDELISIMEESGCRYIFTGLESAVPEILEGLNKTHNTEEYLKKAEQIYNRLRDSEIESSVFLIFGAAKKIKNDDGRIQYIPETFEDVKETLKFSVDKLKPKYISMNILRLLPGVPFSEGKKYNLLWPVDNKIHAGYYDKKWYEQNGITDVRTTHHIYRAFEAKENIVPAFMTPEFCYKILGYIVEKVNKINIENNYKCKIVVDEQFEEAYLECKDGQYKLAPFEEIEDD